ncbi:MAG TPA: hypothetical protein VNZ86_17835 [Bacteroidia bacterium]|jgi:hypothetical protein|nr:hypothetical protein [Bacteroidia bacterium]
MKRSLLKLSAALLLAGAFWIGCSSPSEKVENAEKGVADAKKDLAQANDAYLADIQQNKERADVRAAANDSSIAQFKARISKEKKETRVAYEKKIAELDAKNKDLKREMDEYKASGKDDWEKFKIKFNEEVTAFGDSFRNFTALKRN